MGSLPQLALDGCLHAQGDVLPQHHALVGVARPSNGALPRLALRAVEHALGWWWWGVGAVRDRRTNADHLSLRNQPNTSNNSQRTHLGKMLDDGLSIRALANATDARGVLAPRHTVRVVQ